MKKNKDYSALGELKKRYALGKRLRNALNKRTLEQWKFIYGV